QDRPLRHGDPAGKAGGIDRHRLGPGEEDRAGGENLKRRKEQRPDRIDVGDRVQRHPPHPRGGIVTGPVRRGRVRPLGHREGEQQRGEPEDGGEDRIHVQATGRGAGFVPGRGRWGNNQATDLSIRSVPDRAPGIWRGPMSESRDQQPRGRLPRQIPFIIGNEACERFSFYGMRNILTQVLVGYLLLDRGELAVRESEAKEIFHLFVMGVYFFPLLGGWLADKWLGKYRTILYLSLVYCAGHACLALFESNRTGFYTGLFLIALGSGGIKPCVSSFVGDQFDQSNKHLAQRVYDAFYWIINFGSFFASLLIPLSLEAWGPSVAFGIPGVLMFAATAIFWAGRRHYVNVPPTPRDPHGFSAIARTALLAPAANGRRPGLAAPVAGVLLGLGSLASMPYLGFLSSLCLGLVVFLAFFGFALARQVDRAHGVHPPEDVEGVRTVLRILVIFFLVTPFWSLF